MFLPSLLASLIPSLHYLFYQPYIFPPSFLVSFCLSTPNFFPLCLVPLLLPIYLSFLHIISLLLSFNHLGLFLFLSLVPHSVFSLSLLVSPSSLLPSFFPTQCPFPVLISPSCTPLLFVWSYLLFYISTLLLFFHFSFLPEAFFLSFLPPSFSPPTFFFASLLLIHSLSSLLCPFRLLQPSCLCFLYSSFPSFPFLSISPLFQSLFLCFVLHFQLPSLVFLPLLFILPFLSFPALFQLSLFAPLTSFILFLLLFFLHSTLSPSSH